MYRDVNFKSKTLQDIAETSNDIFKNLKRKWKITEKELKYFVINHKKAPNLGKMYLLRKIHKSLYDVPGRHVISNCGTRAVGRFQILGGQGEKRALMR